MSEIDGMLSDLLRAQTNADLEASKDLESTRSSIKVVSNFYLNFVYFKNLDNRN